MNKLVPLMIAASLALTGTAFAQDAEPVVTLQTQGDVMISTGGEFVTAQPGVPLEPGTRVMVGEGASAQLMYPNACQMPLTAPGVYTVAAVCTPAVATAGTAAATGATTSTAATVGIIAGAVALGAVGISNLDDDDDAPEPPPASR